MNHTFMHHTFINGTITRCLIALLLSFSSQALLAAPASKIQASYDVIGFGMTLANMSETYTRTQDSYQVESVTKAVGLLARVKPETVLISSNGKITAQGLLPLNFSLIREIDKEKSARTKFNWETAVLTHIDYKGVNDMPLPKGTQDRLSLLYHLPVLIKSAQTELKFSISDGNNLQAYSFNLSAGEQNVQVPLGTYKTRYISNTPMGDQVKYEIWLATDYEYFPCKIIVTDSSGGKLTQVLTALTITP
jgi:hypothetical protein